MGITLSVSLSPKAVTDFNESERNSHALQVEVRYVELVSTDDSVVEQVPHTERVVLTGEYEEDVVLTNAFAESIVVAILNGDGSESSSHAVGVTDDKAQYVVTPADIALLLAGELTAPNDGVRPTVRSAQLVPIGSVEPDFVRSRLSVAVVADADFDEGGALSTLGFTAEHTSSVEASEISDPSFGNMAWTAVHVGIDGRFTPTFRAEVQTIGWVWWLSGERQLLGFVRDDLSELNRNPMVIALPMLRPEPDEDDDEVDTPIEGGNGVPADVTEAEVVNNPDIYAEDPGAFCKPFSNPERVLSEKSFAVVARIQQPDIGPMGSANLKSQHLLDLDPAPMPRTRPDIADTAGSAIAAPTGDDLGPAPLVRPEIADTAGSVLTEAGGAEGAPGRFNFGRPTRHRESAVEVELRRRMPSGRTIMSARHPVQWEDDIAQYQAATVALGHILEFRVRSRSNGYSLGTVASTLTLAPRQTKRIQKISFERFDVARRQETTQLDDRVNDQVIRERDYNDTVSAYLSEWATGSSSSSTKAGSGGIGFAIPPIIGGIGGGASKAQSASEQEGARKTTASEEQRLRDAIRRHGDALRRFESTVVSEVSQEEAVTGTTEIIRNPNYAHSLTVIYYQILRHLKVSTEFAGVRECLYVPFAIKPFTLQRAYRWREAIGKYIRSSRFGKAMRHLRDVATDFRFSNMQPGTRAQQHLTYLRGSVYINIAVARPVDQDDGKYDAHKWLAISPFLGSPAFGIWAKLAARSESVRDQLFQKDHAPVIAAKWSNRLTIKAGSANLQADCTIASRYGFNRTVRVDFSVPSSQLSGLSRARLLTMHVVAGAELPPGSVANVSRVVVRYGTANFERTVEGLSGLNDVISVGTGLVDPIGAQVDLPLDAWDSVDERAQLRHSVSELIEHLNEHVEFYHKAIWWSMDRDRLLMLLDGFYVPGTNQVSIASIVDREPLAIIGNSLVYRVGAASFIGYDKVRTQNDLYNLYAEKDPVSDPILISLPTDGLYAQTIMDECLALEEHQGSLDWVLNDPDPDLGTIAPSLLTSRRSDASAATTPTTLPATIINLQNAPDAPAPTGLQNALNAVTSANAFRDMAGLAGSQSNAASALNTAAGLASNFGNKAAAIKIADIAARAQATQNANKQLAAVNKAKGRKLISRDDAVAHANKILSRMHSPKPATNPSLSRQSAIEDAIRNSDGFSISRADENGSELVEVTSVWEDKSPTTGPVFLGDPLLSSCQQKIMQVATQATSLAAVPWGNRGKAQIGYIKGMALVYARVYCKWKAGDPFVLEMAKRRSTNTVRDALAFYDHQFQLFFSGIGAAKAGTGNNKDGVDTLRHLFVLLFGLGMIESSGRACVGRDQDSNSNKTSLEAEAGHFQMSRTIGAGAAGALLIRQYNQLKMTRVDAFPRIFREGFTTCWSKQNAHVDCDTFVLTRYPGPQYGHEFRKFCVRSPAHAAEVAALGLRRRRRHFGTINRNEVVLRAECDELFKKVQAAVDSGRCCAQKTIPEMAEEAAEALDDFVGDVL